MAKISVIVPIYGVEKYLKEAVDSILNQTFTDLEIILLDDGSKDNCPQIIDEYAKKDSRIVVVHKKNSGYGATMNVGLKRATGEYIAILEPDDFIEPNMYEELYKIAKNYDSDIVKSCFYDNLQTKQCSRILKTKWDAYIPEDKSFTIKEYPYFLYYHPSVWSCIYKREFLNKNGIEFVEAPGAGWTDNPFQVQTMCLAERINYTSNAYYYWRRLNINESDDLRDYTIPFKRSDEIHEWLDKNNYNDESILVQLSRRELSYVNIVLGMKKIEDKADCYDRIKKLISRIPSETFFNSQQVRASEKDGFRQINSNPEFLRFKILFKNFRKQVLRIQLSLNKIRIILFGVTVLDLSRRG